MPDLVPFQLREKNHPRHPQGEVVRHERQNHLRRVRHRGLRGQEKLEPGRWKCQTRIQLSARKGDTTLQSMMNAKRSPHRFLYCHESGLIKTIQTIPHNLYVSFSPLLWIKAYPGLS